MRSLEHGHMRAADAAVKVDSGRDWCYLSPYFPKREDMALDISITYCTS